MAAETNDNNKQQYKNKMENKVNVHIIKRLEQVSGTSSKGEWTKDSFVGETYDQYPKRYYFTVMGAKDKNIVIPNEGDDVEVSYDVEARSFTTKDGREMWSNDLKAWKIVLQQENAPEPVQPQSPLQTNYQPSLQSEYQQPQMVNYQQTAPQTMQGPEPIPSDDLPF